MSRYFYIINLLFKRVSMQWRYNMSKVVDGLTSWVAAAVKAAVGIAVD
jgi:hypothetical protein